MAPEGPSPVHGILCLANYMYLDTADLASPAR